MLFTRSDLMLVMLSLILGDAHFLMLIKIYCSFAMICSAIFGQRDMQLLVHGAGRAITESSTEHARCSSQHQDAGAG